MVSEKRSLNVSLSVLWYRIQVINEQVAYAIITFYTYKQTSSSSFFPRLLVIFNLLSTLLLCDAPIRDSGNCTGHAHASHCHPLRPVRDHSIRINCSQPELLHPECILNGSDDNPGRNLPTALSGRQNPPPEHIQQNRYVEERPSSRPTQLCAREMV